MLTRKTTKYAAVVTILALVLGLFPVSSAMAFEAPVVTASAVDTQAGDAYVPPESRIVYNMNMDWRFHKGDVPGAEAVDFDDTSWEVVSVPHTFNDVDSFDEWITHDGEASVWRGIVWYRKHFKLDEQLAGKKVFIEFEGIRQAAYVYVNGQFVGRYEAGVTPFGFDLTSYVNFGDEGNVIAVKNDNTAVAETGTGVSFQWNGRGFNPVYGGLTRDVKLYVMSDVYFTLPLYSNLQTYGTYVYPSEISTDNRTARINIESEVRNESASTRTISLDTVIVDMDGRAVKTIAGDTAVLEAGETRVLKASDVMEDVHFWQPGYPYLYTVYNILREGSDVVDVYPITTGFRKVEFLGGFDTGGIYINNELVYLSGYAQRSTNEWALLGAATPQWISDYDGELMVESNANLVRWMHISPTPNSVEMTDKYGIVAVHPAGDSESDVTGRQWQQRVEVMRDTIIYFRNHPSILFWEAGNNNISPEHMAEMRALKEQLDPYGMRAIGSRGLSAPAAVDQAEYVGTMLNRHYTDYARDQVPIIETEYTRDEAPRRVWDNYSPPDFGYIHDPSSTWTYQSEEFAVISSAVNFYEYYKDRIQGPDTSNEMYSGQAALTWADSNQHGRNYLTETARLSGRVDALRIPKESFYAFQVMQSPDPAIHIVGHWTYPAGTVKDMYVIANHVKSVELFVNGVSQGTVTEPKNVYVESRNQTYQTEFVFAFPDVAWEPGEIRAVGYDENGIKIVETVKETAGEPYAIKLTPIVGPGGWVADGTDPVIIEVEVVDEQGRRVPTDQARIDFEYSGPGRFLGGYNSGKQYSTFKDYIDTEAGVNRVIVRSTREAGEFTLTAKRDGLVPATITLTSTRFEVVDGLTTEFRAASTVELPDELPEYGPDVRPPKTPKPRVLSSGKPAKASSEEVSRGNTADKANDGGPTSRWAAGNGSANQWWKVDLQDIYDLTELQIDWYRSEAYYQYYIEVSTDDRNWTMVVDARDNTERQATVRHEVDVQARFVRITITAMEAGWASMYEFKVYGNGGSGGEWKSPDANANYDFGMADSPLATGYVRVSDATVYTPTWQFGFGEGDVVQAADDPSVSDDLLRDYITSDSATFSIDLVNGDYDVTVIAGDGANPVQTEIRMEGEAMQPVIGDSGEYAERTYKVRLTDGQLNIWFSGLINAIEVIPIPPAPSDVMLYAKNEEKVIIGWTPVNGAMRYNIYRAVDDSDYVLHATVTSTSYEDTISGLEASKLTYYVTTVMEMGEVTLIGESFPSEQLIVDLQDAELEPNWQESFYIASDYFSSTNPLPSPPVLQLIPELPSGVTSAELIWSSDKPEVASVDSYGIVTAKQPGEAKITVRTADSRFSASTTVYVPIISESFDNQTPGFTWGVQTGTAGGSGGLGGTIYDNGGNQVLRFSGGGTGVRSSQKGFDPPITSELVVIDFKWHVGSPGNSPGAQLSIEDSNGNRYVTLQYTQGQEMVYGTGGNASNTTITGTPAGSGLNAPNTLYQVRVALDFEARKIDLSLASLDHPEQRAEVKGIPFDANTTYLDNVGKFQLVLTRASGQTTSWTTWLDDLNVYALQSKADEPVPIPEQTVAYVTAAESVGAGQSLDVTVGVSEVARAFTVMDVVLEYDPAKVTFETVEDGGFTQLAESAIQSLREHLHVLGTRVREAEGQIRILMASAGIDHAIGSAGDLFRVSGKVRADAASGESYIRIAKFDVSLEGDVTEADLSNAEHVFEIRTADRTALIEAIIRAQGIHDAAVEGTSPGQYPPGAKAALLAAIQSAIQVRDDGAATQSEIDAAVQALNAAVDAFLDSVIEEPPAEADKSALIAKIEEVSEQLEEAVEGTKLGQYRSGSKAALAQALAAAEAVRDNPYATQQAVDQATVELSAALEHFMQQLITLVPGQTQITIRDLSILAKYFGTTSNDPEWEQVAVADLFDEGEINIRVLAAIAQMVLADWADG